MLKYFHSVILFAKKSDSFYMLIKSKEFLKFVSHLKTKICIQQI